MPGQECKARGEGSCGGGEVRTGGGAASCRSFASARAAVPATSEGMAVHTMRAFTRRSCRLPPLGSQCVGQRLGRKDPEKGGSSCQGPSTTLQAQHGTAEWQAGHAPDSHQGRHRRRSQRALQPGSHAPRRPRSPEPANSVHFQLRCSSQEVAGGPWRANAVLPQTRSFLWPEPASTWSQAFSSPHSPVLP